MVRNQSWDQINPSIFGVGEAFDRFGASLAVGDFNRDGRDDLGIGVPGEDVGSLEDAGAANVIYGSSSGLTANGNQIWTQETFGVKGVEEEFDRFGSSLASADFNGDNRADLAIGVPGESVGDIQSAGAVNVLYSSSAGVDTPNDQIWEQGKVEGVAEEKDRFGDALETGDFNGDGYDDLAIGVDGEDVGSISSAGAVNVLYGSDSGLTDIGNQIWDQSQPGVRGVPEQLDLFGSSITSGDFNGDGFDDLSIGVPFEGIGSIFLAGAVNVLYGTTNGLTATADQIWHQNTSMVAGVANRNELFGLSQASGDFDGDGFDDLAIGAPGTGQNPSEGGIGEVNVLYGSAGGLTAIGNQIWTQNSPGIIDSAETGDLFGTSLGVGDFNGDGADDLTIGVPGEDVGNISDAGAVNVIYGSPGLGLTIINQIWHQNTSGVEGIAESGDRFGSSLGVGDLNGDGFDDLAIGVSGEDSGNISNSGAVNVLYGSASGLTAGIG